MINECVACKGSDLYIGDRWATWRDSYWFFPGLRGWFEWEKFKMIICNSCGYIHWFVHPKNLKYLKGSRRFKPLREQ